jgi:CubicO group peptidase (beta-lactamase class C family)
VLLWPPALENNPGAAYLYSTHAYTFLGAALEGAVGDPLGTIFEDTLRAPFNLGTLTLEDRSIPNKFRASLYNTDNDEVGADDLSWKVLGGGLEASAFDLARFGILVQNGSILGTAALNALWTPPDGLLNYAYGWNTGTHKGARVVAKDGAQNGARSYIRIYPDDNIVIVVLTNRKNGGHSPAALAKAIGGLMLDAAAAQAVIPAAPLADPVVEPVDEAQDPAEVELPVHKPTANPTSQDLEEPVGWPFVGETVFLPLLRKP